MAVYANCDPRLPLGEIAAHARRVEAMGYDGLHVAETVHDSLAAALLALDATERIVVRTAVTLAFVRSPTLVAYTAWDLAKLSGGRFQLGLGTQVRQNVEDRFGMPWADPAERMADYLDALDALFEGFRTGAGIDHRGPHYRLTRLQPYFNPGPDEDTAPPPVWLGGVNPAMCRLAGARADGFVTHPTNSDPRYLEAVCLPNLHAGSTEAGRDPAAVEVVVSAPIVTGLDAAGLGAERERQRRLLAFLFSTPAYRPTLERHGWDELGPALRSLIRDERWDALGAVLTDDVLDTLVVSATHDDLADALADRFAGLVTGVVVPPPVDIRDDESFTAVVDRVRSLIA